MREKRIVLLVGNAVNMIAGAKSWEHLLREVFGFLGVSNEIDKHKIKAKPFPLLYEEAFLRASARSTISEKSLKEFISELVQSIKPNEIHQRIMEMGIRHILTTNYEFSLEQCGSNYVNETTNVGHIVEKKYSIFRHHSVGKTNVWHIHGGCDVPESITLGYEHYCGYIQKMRNYVVTDTQYSKKNLDNLLTRIDEEKVDDDSWLDFFFMDDVHIMGLALDTSEIDLWWLLTLRARQMINKGRRVKGRVFYYYPESLEKKARARFQLLEAAGVELVRIGLKHGIQYYEQVLKRIESIDGR